jgi:PAS domain-containing protein
MRQRIDQYAIVIGVDHYDHLSPLKSAVKDATAFAGWLISADGAGLPDENIKLLLARPSAASSSRASVPMKLAVDRALRELGIGSGARVGQRLIFYFAGYSLLSGTEDVWLLLSDWTPAASGSSISLRHYREFFQEATPFDEVVFVLDTQRLEQPATGSTFGLPEFSQSRKWAPDRDVAMLSIGHFPPADGVVERRGRLTAALLDGLNGKAAGHDGRITASSLGRFVRTRVAELEAESLIEHPAGLRLEQSGEIVFGEVPQDDLLGTLIVELPHWTAEINVYDSQYRRIPDLGPVTEDPPGSGSYQAEISLTKGIYQVEARLRGAVESQFILLHAGKTARIKQDTWKTLAFKSAAPLAQVALAHKEQVQHAEEQSLEPTWAAAPGGDSRLFLFVRTEDPEQHPAFYEGLKLLDQAGELVTDFAHGVKKSRRGGWMAFTANLPSGLYILRRGRSGVRLRQQPVFLCANWETHVFLEARDNFPSLSTMTLDMSPLGSGFHPNDAATAAVEAVMNSLAEGGLEPGLVVRSRLQTLLDEKKNNPWLGILASHVLLRAGVSENSELGALLYKILAYLDGVIGEHPDVRALHLREDWPAREPFWYPPLLRPGLVLVQAHATRHVDTIPIDSLTDVILDNAILNTPWTAWRHLDRRPVLPHGEKIRSVRPLAKKAVEESLPAARPVTKMAPPHLPVYQYTRVEGDDSALTESDFESSEMAPAQTIDLLDQASLLWQVQSLTAATSFEERPPAIRVNLGGSVDDLLSSVNPEDVSSARGISLARAERGLEELQQRKQPVKRGPADQDLAKTSFSADERTVFNYAVQQQVSSYPRSGARGFEEGDAILESGAALPLGGLSQIGTLTRVTIEDIALTLATEGDRLLSSGLRTGHPEAARALAEQMQEVAEALFTRADYLALTDPQGHITHSNGAFLALISRPRESGPTAEISSESGIDPVESSSAKNRRLWEEALRTIQAAGTELSDPLQGTDGPVWVFKRTIINDENETPRAILYDFRQKGAGTLPGNVLPAMAEFLPELTFNSSMFAYSVGEDASSYLKNLEKVVGNLKTLLQ